MSRIKRQQFWRAVMYALYPGLHKWGEGASQTKWRKAGKKTGRELSNIFMAETEGNASLKRKKNSEGNFEVYGFGYNGFKQLGAHIFEGDQEPPQNSSYCISKSKLLYPLALNVPRVSSIAASWSSTVFVKGRYAVLFGRLCGKCVPLFIIYHSSFDNKSHACYFSIQETAVSYIHRAL